MNTNSINITLDGSKISNKQIYTRGFEKLGIVFLSFSFITYAFNPATWTKIGSIPRAYAPSTDFYFTMQESYYDTYNPYVCYVDAQGDIYIRGKSLSSGSYIRGSVSYLKGK